MKSFVTMFFCLLQGLRRTASFEQVYGQPVVGILTFPTDDALGVGAVHGHPYSGKALEDPSSYFDASYVLWLGEGGARAVAIPYDIEEADLEELFGKLNGVLFTGGPAKPESFPTYFETAKALYNMVLSSEEYVPLWGTFLGFETISSIVAEGGEDAVLSDFDAEQLSLPLVFTEQAEASRLYGGTMPPTVREIFAGQNITTNWHTYGVGVDSFAELLAGDAAGGLVATSTNFDRAGLEFVSSFEHSSKPVYAVQWHPEANQFDNTDKKGDGTPNRGADAVEAVSYLARFFVDEARKNSNRFEDEDDFTKWVLAGDMEGVDYDGWIYWFA